jgi:hypothetical protein
VDNQPRAGKIKRGGKNMGYRDEWSGTKKELIGLVEFCIEDIRKELDINISDRDMRKLFCEAFGRNIVQAELREMIAYILDEEEKDENERKCRVCGCTEDNACEGGCYWVEEDLCSKCAEKMEED